MRRGKILPDSGRRCDKTGRKIGLPQRCRRTPSRGKIRKLSIGRISLPGQGRFHSKLRLPFIAVTAQRKRSSAGAFQGSCQRKATLSLAKLVCLTAKLPTAQIVDLSRGTAGVTERPFLHPPPKPSAQNHGGSTARCAPAALHPRHCSFASPCSSARTMAA